MIRDPLLQPVRNPYPIAVLSEHGNEDVARAMGVVIATGAAISAVWTRARVSPVDKE